MPEHPPTEHNRIALTVYAVVRLHRAHMNNQQRRDHEHGRAHSRVPEGFFIYH